MKTDGNQEQEIIVPLGKALKDARLATSLTLDEVAEKLNLSISMVRELEDDLDEILATKRYPVIYLRGYLANYAKLLGLTTLELFVEYKQLDTIQKKSKSLHAPSLMIPPVKKRSNLLPLLLILVIVILATVYAFQDQLFTRVEQVPDPLISTPVLVTEQKQLSINNIVNNEVTEPVEADEVVEFDAQINTDDKSVVEVSIETVVELPAEVVSETHVEVAPDASIEVAVEDDVEADVSKEVQSTLQTEVKQPIKVNDVTDTAPSASDTPANVELDTAEQTSAVALVNERLIISFTGECWTEIFDATGKRIAFGLYNSGRVLELSGVAPFQLKLGDPSVTEIQYKEQIIEGDFAPGRSAQFSVPLS